MPEVEDAFFCPAAGDEGLAVGAALVGYFEMTTLSGKKPEKVPISSIYFGTSFSNEEIESSLKKHNLLENAQFVDDIDDEIGELISKPDTIVARFSGAMEWGPRGLGNRSILADPSNPNIVRKINKAIKMRDFWMPFGPSILSSRMDEYLIDAEIAPYMILAFDTTEKRNDLAAAIHPPPQSATRARRSERWSVPRRRCRDWKISPPYSTTRRLRGWGPERAAPGRLRRWRVRLSPVVAPPFPPPGWREMPCRGRYV